MEQFEENVYAVLRGERMPAASSGLLLRISSALSAQVRYVTPEIVAEYFDEDFNESEAA